MVSLALAASAACHRTFNAHKSCCDVGATLKFFPVFNHIPDVVCPAVAFPLTAQYLSPASGLAVVVAHQGLLFHPPADIAVGAFVAAGTTVPFVVVHPLSAYHGANP